MSIKDSFKKAMSTVGVEVTEDTPKAEPVKRVVNIPTVFKPGPALPAAWTPEINSTVFTSNQGSESATYLSLKSKTDFSATEIGKVIMKYFDALESTGMDSTARYKAAMIQASKIDGVLPSKILEAFDTMKNQLQKESASFSATANLVEKNEISTRQQHIMEIDSQIASLNTEKQRVSSDLTQAQIAHTTVTQDFSVAYEKRVSEIEQQRTQFSAMLNK